MRQKAARRARGDRGDMDWSVPDEEYWKTIPAAAHAIPRDWSSFPVVRFTNTELGGVREVRFVQAPEYDQWLLNDPEHEIHACISVDRQTHRIYFMELKRRRKGDWTFLRSVDNCYSCHASGPRVIRPFREPRVNFSILASFNRRILSYGVCNFGDSINLVLRGKPINDSSCTSCHDGTGRGRLYEVHRRTILFKTMQERTMPPEQWEIARPDRGLAPADPQGARGP